VAGLLQPIPGASIILFLIHDKHPFTVISHQPSELPNSALRDVGTIYSPILDPRSGWSDTSLLATRRTNQHTCKRQAIHSAYQLSTRRMMFRNTIPISIKLGECRPVGASNPKLVPKTIQKPISMQIAGTKIASIALDLHMAAHLDDAAVSQGCRKTLRYQGTIRTCGADS
jgi:hypothetical protein